ncbi:transposase (ISH3) [Natronococcus jeotgali DSM 18795]|uniref:Transposase (ISH3) n=1 Tax=Natronococcus jeotgali DSM 18795 TaxID=1227498 RepID=L9XEL8_9EURY|nr:transposase (ISH3) [Natronococcus jeotgali DSM 18795]
MPEQSEQADNDIHEDQLLNFLVNTINEEVDLDLGANAKTTSEDIYEVLVGAMMET